MPPDTYAMSWPELQKLLLDFAQSPKAQGFTGILPIARGGLIPATILSYLLNLHMLPPITAKSYDGQTQREVQIEPFRIAYGGKLLVVDDILDTGKTTIAVIDHPMTFLDESTFLYLIHKGKMSLNANMIALSKTQTRTQWVTFPWE